MIIHLNGWPGVGKMTIGRLLADSLEARFIHNHVLHDVAFTCAGYGDKDRWPLYEKVRKAAYDVLEHRPSSETFVMTNALCSGEVREEEAWGHVVTLAIKRGVPLIPVVLKASTSVIASRVCSEDRLSTKLKDPAELVAMTAEYKLQIPHVAECIEIDVGALSAVEASKSIQNSINKLAIGIGPATEKHRVFK